MTTLSSFQNQLDAAEWRNKVVYLPPDGLDIQDTPLIARGCTISGSLNFSTPHPVRGRAQLRLHESDRPGIILQGPGAGLTNCIIDYPENGTRFPRAAPPAVLGRGGGILLSELVFFGAYDAIHLKDAGQCRLERIAAQVFNRCIYLQNGQDVTRLRDIHLWPNTTTSRETTMQAYFPPGNGRGVTLEDCTWVEIDGLFVFGAHVGLAVNRRDQSPAGGSSVTGGILQFDACNVGLDVYGIADNDTVMISTLKMAGNTAYGGSPLIGMILRGERGDVMIGSWHLHGEIAHDFILEDGFRRSSLLIGNMARR